MSQHGVTPTKTLVTDRALVHFRFEKKVFPPSYDVLISDDAALRLHHPPPLPPSAYVGY